MSGIRAVRTPKTSNIGRSRSISRKAGPGTKPAVSVRQAPKSASTYQTAGVDIKGVDAGLSNLLKNLVKTSSNRPGFGKELVKNGYFASVLDFGNLGLALSTDGVGTKIIIAEMLEKYDTIGIDLIAMNVNDILCVGAEPVAMLDYIAIEESNPKFFQDIGKGLLKGANEAGISIPAGEIAQVKDLIRGVKPGKGFDLVGTALGWVDKKKIILGDEIKRGDVLIGLASSGLHSNGYTLARKVLLNGSEKNLAKPLAGTNRTLGAALLEPTKIYVKGILKLLGKNLKIKALTHITGDGLLNLLRVQKKVSILIENLPKPHPVFEAIQKKGKISDAEMFTVFNMGIGFVVTVALKDKDRCLKILAEQSYKPTYLGYVDEVLQKGNSTIYIKEKGLIGSDKVFRELGKF